MNKNQVNTKLLLGDEMSERAVIKIKNIKNLIFISLFVLLTIFPFFFYLHGALHIDESYFMFVGNSILHDSIPYKDYIDIKPPGIYYLFALTFSIFGKSFYAARAVLFIFNALSAIILFLIGRKLWNKETGMLSSMLFLIGISIPAYSGYYALADPFMVFFGLFGVLLFFKSGHWIYLILSGILIGLSTLFKQPGGLFLAMIFAFYLLKLWMPENRTKGYLKDSVKNMILISCGFLMPMIITIVYFWSVDVSDSFIYWSFLFPLKGYAHYLIFSKRIILDLAYQFLSYSIIWILSFVSIFIIVYGFIKKEAKDKDIFTMIWCIISIYPLTIRQYGHYYVQILPPACLLASISLIKVYPILSLGSIKESLSKGNHLKIFAIVCVLALMLSSFVTIAYGEYRLQKSRSICFDDQLNTAEYIKSHTSANEKILSFPYDPSIYFLSDRDPPTRWLIMHKSVVNESHVIQQIKENDVQYITVWNSKKFKGKFIQQPIYAFILENYGTKNIYEFILENYEIEKSIGMFDIYKKNDG